MRLRIVLLSMIIAFGLWFYGIVAGSASTSLQPVQRVGAESVRVDPKVPCEATLVGVNLLPAGVKSLEIADYPDQTVVDSWPLTSTGSSLMFIIGEDNRTSPWIIYYSSRTNSFSFDVGGKLSPAIPWKQKFLQFEFKCPGGYHQYIFLQFNSVGLHWTAYVQ